MNVIDELLQAGLLRRLDVLERCLLAASLPADDVVRDQLSCGEPIQPVLKVDSCAVTHTGSVQMMHPLPRDLPEADKPMVFVVREFWGRVVACPAGFQLCQLLASDQPVVLLDDATDSSLCKARALDRPQPGRAPSRRSQTVYVACWRTDGLPVGCFWSQAQAEAFAKAHGIAAAMITVSPAMLFPEEPVG